MNSSWKCTGKIHSGLRLLMSCELQNNLIGKMYLLHKCGITVMGKISFLFVCFLIEFEVQSNGGNPYLV